MAVKKPAAKAEEKNVPMAAPQVEVKIMDSFKAAFEQGKWTDEKHDSPVPLYKTKMAAGADLYSTTTVSLLPGQTADIPVGIALGIPEGWEGEIRGRSGYWFGQRIMGFNGTIDADYAGEVMVSVVNLGTQNVVIKPGFRVGQILYRPVHQLFHKVVDELTPKDSNRDGGFGSTGGAE